MFRVIDKPDTGKTRKLLQECSNNRGVFVCKHPEKVVDKCIAYGIDPTTITAISYSDFVGYLTTKPHKELVYIDDLDLFLELFQKVSLLKLGGYGITVED